MIDILSDTYINTKGRPVLVEFDTASGKQSIILKPNALFNASFYGASNISVDGKPLFGDLLKNVGDIVKKAAILDLETQNKIGGSVITEAALYRTDENIVDVFFTKPYHTVELTSKDFETGVKLSTKNRRYTSLVRTKTAPRSHAASFFTSHLVDILQDQKATESLARYVVGFDAGEVKNLPTIIATQLSPLKKNKLDLAEQILRTDRGDQFLDMPAVRDYLLKYTAQKDPFQTRYYVKDAAEAQRLGISRTLFGDAADAKIHEYYRYLRDQDYLSGRGGMADLQSRIEQIFSERFGRSDIQVRTSYVDIEDLIYRDLPQLVEGYNVQASYSLFEAKQTGGNIRAILTRKLLDEGMRLEDITQDVIERELAARGKPFESVLEGVSYTGEPFYTTGEEYRLKKAMALKHNKFSELLKPYLSSTRITSARDIQDVQKITQGIVDKIGIADIPKPQAMAVEVQSRLFGAAGALAEGQDPAEVIRQLLEKEAHIAGPDAAISSPKILKQALSFSIAGSEFLDQTAFGKQLYEEALQGKGSLFGLFAYGKLSNFYAQSFGSSDLGLMDILYEQRIARNLETLLDTENLNRFQTATDFRLIDIPQTRIEGGRRIVESGKDAYARMTTYVGIEGLYEDARLIQKDYAGVNAEETIHRLFSRFKDTNDKLLFDYDDVKKTYNLPARPTLAARESFASDLDYQIARYDYENSLKTYEERMSGLRSRVSQFTESNQAQIDLFKRRAVTVQDTILSDIQESLRRSEAFQKQNYIVPNVKVSSRSTMERVLGAHETIKAAKKLTLGVAGFGLAMSGLSTLEQFQQPERSSYLIPSYEEWFTSQAQMFGNDQDFIREMQARTGYISGMNESGIGSMMRKAFSDFGSPYAGPAYSDYTLQQNELLRERQKLLRQRYAFRHLSYEGDIKAMLSSFISKAFEPGAYQPQINNTYLINSNSVGAAPYTDIKGQNLTKVSVSGNYKIDIQDADTITLSRNFGNSGMRDFFFGRKQSQNMSIRLAGIDAPETAHENRGAQPYAEAAKRIAMDMINKAKNVEVVFDDSDSTYGRRVGVVYADGKNVNLELIKRGAAGYLPYRSNKKQSIYDQNEFKAAENLAYKSKRGMWRSDYFRAYKEMSNASGQTVTFNTLVNTSKVATNTSLMTMYSAMNTAAAFGMQSTEAQMAVADSGLQLKNKANRNSENIFKPDFNSNEWADPSIAALKPSNSILAGIDELKYDLKDLIDTRGGNVDHKHASGNTRHLNDAMARDIVSPRGNGFDKQYGFKATQYNRRYNRMKMMETLQQREAQRMFNYSSGHYRM